MNIHKYGFERILRNRMYINVLTQSTKKKLNFEENFDI